MSDIKTEASASGPPVQRKETEPRIAAPSAVDSGVPSSGRRVAFRDVRRQLTDDELSHPGVQKLLLDILQEVDEDCDYLKSFVTLYHEADKKAAILSEKLLMNTTIEVFFGVGVGLGGTIIGLAPFLWGSKPEYGLITVLVGVCMIIGSTVGRMVKR